jgi:N utilization substance protein B
MNTDKKLSRRAERALAFQVLYGLSFSPAPTRLELADAFLRAPEQDGPSPSPVREARGFAWELVEGVWESREKLDALLTRYSQNWRVERMGKVEITLLRLALYEMLFRQDIPPKVAMNEAIELSKQFGDQGSRGFVNGILDAAVKELENGAS